MRTRPHDATSGPRRGVSRASTRIESFPTDSTIIGPAFMSTTSSAGAVTTTVSRAPGSCHRRTLSGLVISRRARSAACWSPPFDVTAPAYGRHIARTAAREGAVTTMRRKFARRLSVPGAIAATTRSPRMTGRIQPLSTRSLASHVLLGRPNDRAKPQRGHIRVMPKASQFNNPLSGFSVR
jgi:hypothetical protein